MPHPDYLYRLLDGRQMAEWEAYEQTEPFGEYRADARNALLASTVANYSQRSDPKRPTKVSDFMLKFERRKAQTVDQMLFMLEQLNAAAGGQDLRKGKKR